MRQGSLVTLALLAIITIAACSKRQPAQEPAPQTPTSTPTPPPSGTGNTGGNRPAADPNEEVRRKLSVMMETVYFDYDEATIRQDAATSLQAKLPILREDASIRFRVEGHADERGSLEYNLALGQRRAQAVKDYLVGFGIDASRITVQSFGEDRPADPGSNESAWALNRRAEFVITAGLGR
jgi:peptidoglycan-associated lipoprotein